MIDIIKSVSKVPINTVASDSDEEDNEERHPKRRKAIEYKVDIVHILHVVIFLLVIECFTDSVKHDLHYCVKLLKKAYNILCKYIPVYGNGQIKDF